MTTSAVVARRPKGIGCPPAISRPTPCSDTCLSVRCCAREVDGAKRAACTTPSTSPSLRRPLNHPPGGRGRGGEGLWLEGRVRLCRPLLEKVLGKKAREVERQSQALPRASETPHYAVYIERACTTPAGAGYGRRCGRDAAHNGRPVIRLLVECVWERVYLRDRAF
ncbi:hypothetical protein M433DRAFT_189833 [Acidomyces richmondensis BFW]|nr:hypothetical protein M433DRAFT_189833 [Acidomyces richmondensis BFW]